MEECESGALLIVFVAGKSAPALGFLLDALVQGTRSSILNFASESKLWEVV
jgi:hypothetical protein